MNFELELELILLLLLLLLSFTVQQREVTRDSEAGTHYLGWISAAFNEAPNLGIKLYRDPNVTAKENTFHCNNKNNKDESMEVGIFYQNK